MKNTGDIRIDKLMPRLHEAWPILPFEECLVPCNIRYRKLKTTEIKPSGMIPVIDQGESLISGYTDEPANEYPGPLPIIIFGDHTRRFKFVDFKFAVGAEGTHLLYPFGALESKFFYYYLSALSLESQGYSRHYKFLKEALVPVPPLGEQRRIVAKLELLLGRVDACKQRLAKIPVLLKRFRQSVLAAACSGRLTEDWREENPDAEPASELLGRIRAERMRKRPSQKPIIGNGNEADIPVSWVWTTAGALCDCIVPNRDKPKTFSGDIPWITMPDFGEMMEIGGNSSGLGLTREETLQYRAKVVPAGSVVMSCIGRFGVAAVLTRNAVINQQLHAFLVPSELERKYLVYAIRSQEEAMNQMATSTTIAYLNKTNCNSVPVPLPPLPEQREIVRRVEALFALADNIEQRYKKAQAFIDKLTPSLLAKAFRGELVPQDPNDEPASALLERIKAERGKNNPQGHRKRG